MRAVGIRESGGMTSTTTVDGARVSSTGPARSGAHVLAAFAVGAVASLLAPAVGWMTLAGPVVFGLTALALVSAVTGVFLALGVAFRGRLSAPVALTGPAWTVAMLGIAPVALGSGSWFGYVATLAAGGGAVAAGVTLLLWGRAARIAGIVLLSTAAAVAGGGLMPRIVTTEADIGDELPVIETSVPGYLAGPTESTADRSVTPYRSGADVFALVVELAGDEPCGAPLAAPGAPPEPETACDVVANRVYRESAGAHEVSGQTGMWVVRVVASRDVPLGDLENASAFARPVDQAE